MNVLGKQTQSQSSTNLQKRAGHGGRREGAGRKKLLPGQPNHVKRPVITGRTPVHVTLKLNKGLPSLRKHKYLLLFAEAVRGAQKFGLRVQHFSILSNHIHFIAEADNGANFSRGLQSLTIRFAKAVGRNRIFCGRYHAHVLKTSLEVKNALAYVLQNLARHWDKGGTRSKRDRILVQDPFSSLHTLRRPEILFGTLAKTKSARDYFKGRPWYLDRIQQFLSPARSHLLLAAGG